MTRNRIAIACQGGGSQCAFVAGALKTLLAQGVHRRYDIVGLSGTSGGALTAALAWLGLLEYAHGKRTGIEDRILGFWKDLSAQSLREILFDQFAIQMLRMQEGGFTPSFASSPSSVTSRLSLQAVSFLLGRREFTDLRLLLEKHMDFAAVSSLIQDDSPVLLVGAADVLDGGFKIFSSAHNEIQTDSLLASAAIPTLFPAVWVDGHAYWDGIFSSNPPVSGFFRKPLMGQHALPDEVWIIQVNAVRSATVPERPSDIFDRRNQLAGNLSLNHELEQLRIVNVLLQEHVLNDHLRAQFGLEAKEQITVRFIRMSEAVAQKLDYASKLSRQPSLIAKLIAEGEAQAIAFLETLEDAEHLTERTGASAHVEFH
jgi:NTE family protein